MQSELVMVTVRYHAFHRPGPKLDGRPLVPVRTSIGVPKWITGADAWPQAFDLVPWALLGIEGNDELVARHHARLDAVGADALAGRLAESIL